MGAPVSILGMDLVMERVWSRRPRLLHDGRELPRDRWGSPVLVDADGRSHQLQTGFTWRQLSPTVEVDGHQTLVFAPLSTPVRCALLVFVVLGFLSGALGVALSMGAALVSAMLLRHPHRHVGHVIGAVVVPLVAMLLYAVVSALLA